jgi:16S rRNA (uracil1498-N3)-methyltransferase
MSERFFLTAPPAAGRAVLTGDEARHLARVLRASVGDEVTLFDGRGRSWPARVAAIGRDSVQLETGEPRVELAGGTVLTLAVALPKGERQKWLVEKLTELGVARLVPLVTERGVAEATASAVARLGRGVIEASKQCGRDTLMEIAAPASVAAVVAAAPAGGIGLVADPPGTPLDPAGWSARAEVIGLIGPEGGFSDAELALTDAAGWPRIALGPHVLRVETAAVALAARLAAPAGGAELLRE